MRMQYIYICYITQISFVYYIVYDCQYFYRYLSIVIEQRGAGVLESGGHGQFV